jgi:DUF1680 family protein
VSSTLRATLGGRDDDAPAAGAGAQAAAPRAEVVQLEQHSQFPLNTSSTITFTAPTPGSVGLKLRVPKWSSDGEGGRVTVNGVEVQAVQTGELFVLAPRKWRAQDTVSVTFPCQVRLQRIEDSRAEYGGFHAFLYGDTLLVGLETEHNSDNSLVVRNTEQPAKWTSRTGGGHLRFTAHTAHRSLELMPLNEVVDELYTVYYNMTVANY